MKPKKSVFAILIISVIVFLVIPNCGQKQIHTIRIGLLSIFSGDGATYGNAARTGVDLAVEEINAKGGVNGKKIEIIYEDSKGNPKDALSGFQKLATVDKVPVVIGPFYSGEVMSCAPEADRSKVVLISGSATSDNIITAGDYVFRVCPTNEIQARTIAKFIINELNKKTAFTLFRNVDYGVTLRDKFREVFTDLGGSILGEEGIEADASDVRVQLNKVKAKNPEVIYAAVHYTEGGAILRQAKEMNINSIVIGTDGGYNQNLFTIAGDAANGSYWATIGWGEKETVSLKEKFINNYKEKYGIEPDSYSGLYYDAVMVVAEAMKNSDVLNGATLKNELYKIKDFKGPTGITSFDEYGEVNKPFTIYIVKNQKFVEYK